jgi:hypothetical protein
LPGFGQLGFHSGEFGAPVGVCGLVDLISEGAFATLPFALGGFTFHSGDHSVDGLPIQHPQGEGHSAIQVAH